MNSGEGLTRRFNLADAMILVAATALGLSLLRLFSFGGFSYMFRDQSFFVQRTLLACTAAFMAWPLVVSWTLAAFVLAILPPRRKWRHLMRRPGVVAETALGMGSVGSIGLMILLAFKYEAFAPGILLVSGFPMGFMVMSAWGYQILSGRWRPEPSWIDRMGRVLGFYWVALVPVSLVVTYLLAN